MKGVVLAGGLGTRMLPMTRVTNKHLLPVYDRPMVYFPIQQLVHAGVREVLVVTGGNHADEFSRLLGNGEDFGFDGIRYAYQEGEGGIAEALALAREFSEGEPLCVILGDNIFERPIRPAVEAYEAAGGQGAMILLKEVDDPERFGVAEVEGDRVLRITEKPDVPKSSLAVTGCYLYDARVFEIIDGLDPSARGELEITDVNNRYIEWGAMRHAEVTGWWTDAGTISSLYRATRFVAEAVGNPVLRGPGAGQGAR